MRSSVYVRFWRYFNPFSTNVLPLYHLKRLENRRFFNFFFWLTLVRPNRYAYMYAKFWKICWLVYGLRVKLKRPWFNRVNTGRRCFLEVSFYSHQIELVLKKVLGIFKIVLSLKDRHVFMSQSLRVLRL